MAMNPRLLRPRSVLRGPITTGLEGWWDPADLSTVTLNGGSVSGLADKSGKGRNATQSTAALQPTWTSASNRIDCTSNQRLVLPSAISLSGDFTIFSVLSQASAANGFSLLEGSASTSSQTVQSVAFYFNAFPGTGWTTTLRTGANPNLTTGSWVGPSIVRMRRNGTAGVFALSNAATTFTALNSTITPDVIVGGSQNNISRNQRHQEILIYTRALSDSEVAMTERYLAAKWGITLA